ncbi:MAG: molybdopterin-dependent oxidoreductase, partial [Spirochaeta sp.]|nr:molybdopterin-dependent oxidoreductase [Spirochaeta sp.]
MNDFLNIGKAVPKRDSLSLAAGREKFTADIKLDNPLHLALLYSPHAHAEIVDIDYAAALKLEGVVEILCYKNVSRVLHTTAGQGFPEPSPYDTVLFDKRVRFVGDRVALVAAESMEIARQALSLIKVEYRLLEELFDMEKSMSDSAPRIHVDDEFAKIPVPYQPEKNLAATLDITFGDPDKGFREADFAEERTYSMHNASHCAIEPHTAGAFFDEQGRLVIITSTQVPFHVRRIVGYLLDIPTGEIRVIKPRIGGGFGGKQEVLLEPLAALVAWRKKRAAIITLSRSEVFISTRTRHAMRIRLKTGVSRGGRITALDMDALMNAGAYGPHALTVLSNTGSKVLPLFNKIDHLKFKGRTVYTNLPVGGAYRGYGATQGYFALNQHLDIIARRLERDPIELCKEWHIGEGEGSQVFEVLGEGTEGVEQIIKSCKLDECLDRGAAAIGWQEKRNRRLKGSKDRVRGVGLAAAMQGSGIPEVDMG